MKRFDDENGRVPRGRIGRLVVHLRAVGRLLDDDRPSAEQRLVAMLGRDRLEDVRRQLEPTSAEAPTDLRAEPEGASRLSRVRSWQWSVFFVALGSGATVSIVGLIDLIWRVRGIVGGLGAIGVVVAVYLQTRRHRLGESWIGS